MMVALAVVRQEDSGVAPTSSGAGSFFLPQTAIWISDLAEGRSTMSTPAPPSATVSSPLSVPPVAAGSSAARAAYWSWKAGTSATSSLSSGTVRGE
jgi:hypothetical protein